MADAASAEMNAIAVVDDRLQWRPTATPRPGPGEIRMQVAATAVNRADLLQRIGRYPVPRGASEILGLEAAGTVAEVGEGVERGRIGDRVCALLAGGGYAEQVVCPAEVTLPVPEGLSLGEAAALPEALYTAYLNLVIEGQLAPGERALIHAGGSGVGTIAIQLCRALGSPVYTTASAPKLERLLALGADAAIDRQQDDFLVRLRELTGGEGIDVILDPVGGPYLERNLKVLRRGGRLVLIGLLGGATAELPLGRVLMSGARIIGSTLRNRPLAQKIEITRQIADRIWPLVGRGEIRPVIERRFPVADADAAHELMRTNSTFGKLVLEVTAGC